MHGKILFANQLRGLAALFVVASHLGAVFWGMRDIVAAHIGAPIYGGPAALTLPWLSFRYFSLGPFGVAVFFLISGFVIPMSLEKLSPLRFLVARVFRIYPTFIAASCVTLAAVWVTSHHYHLPFPIDKKELLSNLTLMQSILGTESMDLVNWTLQIEIKFYILAACLAPFILRARISPLLLVACVSAGLNIATMHTSSGHIPSVAIETMYISFMLIGILFNYAIRGRINLLTLAGAALTIFGIFLFTLKHSSQAGYFEAIWPSEAIALAMFSACYLARGYFRPNRVLDFFADISYPLYVVHSMTGYAIMRVLLDHGMNLYACQAIAVLCGILIAWALHRFIETPSAEFGKRAAKAFTVRKTAAN